MFWKRFFRRHSRSNSLNSINSQEQERKGHDVMSNFDYLTWQTELYSHERPFQLMYPVPKHAKDQRKDNLVLKTGRQELIRDVRGQDYADTIDVTGFAFRKSVTQLSPEQFHNRELIESVYLPECEKLLRETIGEMDKVVFFHWATRQSGLDAASRKAALDWADPLKPLNPATTAHVDQTGESVLERVRMMFPDEADELLKGRVRQMNIWRPIGGPVQDYPLAVCDYRSAVKKELIVVDRVRPKHTLCTYQAKFDESNEEGSTTPESDRLRWHYMSQQQDDEAIVFKTSDTQPDVAQYAIHSAFKIPGVPDTVPTRQSIEVRALVFTHATA